MSLRDLVGVGLLGAAVWGFWRRGAATLPGTLLTPPTGKIPASATPSSGDYAAKTIARESAGDANAKNPLSSASGLYQFTKATWQRLGGAWGSDPTKPFGGLAVTAAEQTARFNQLTAANAGALQRAGLAVTNATLYAAHFLGSPVAVKVLRAPNSTSLATLVGSRVMAQNPHLAGFTVGDFRRWLETRT